MMAARAQLSNREISLLLYVMARVGLCGRMALTPARRAHVAGLWRRHLIEIWYRCAPGEGCTHGPYFNLTIDGHRLASALRAARDARRAKLDRPRVSPQVAA
jgi:hypothetical protein